MPMSPHPFGSYMRDDIAHWSALAKAHDIEITAPMPKKLAFRRLRGDSRQRLRRGLAAAHRRLERRGKAWIDVVAGEAHARQDARVGMRESRYARVRRAPLRDDLRPRERRHRRARAAQLRIAGPHEVRLGRPVVRPLVLITMAKS